MVNRGLPSQEVLSGQYFQNRTFYVNQGIATRPLSSRRQLKVWALFMAHHSYLWHPVNSKKSRQVLVDKGSSSCAASDRPHGPQTQFTQDIMGPSAPKIQSGLQSKIPIQGFVGIGIANTIPGNCFKSKIRIAIQSSCSTRPWWPSNATCWPSHPPAPFP